MPLFRRLPKRGFSNVLFKKSYAIINVQALEEQFKSGAKVDPKTLAEAGLIHRSLPVKILGQGQIKKKLDVTAAAFSASAIKKIEEAGGSATVAP